jgi:hypothetical protein
MGNEASGGHAMDLGNWVEMLQGSYLCTSENINHKKIELQQITQSRLPKAVCHFQ